MADAKTSTRKVPEKSDAPKPFDPKRPPAYRAGLVVAKADGTFVLRTEHKNAQGFEFTSESILFPADAEPYVDVDERG